MSQFLVAMESLLRVISISDVIDIAILSLIIYRLIIIIRRTRTGQIATGVLLVLGAVWLSSLLRLNAVSFLLNLVLEWGFLALVILFQPEIRRFLMSFGSGKFMIFFNKNQMPQYDMEAAITQTVLAFAELSKARIGALMVFERQNMLDDVIKTGTSLGSMISAELLKNIFWPKAPMHDGAVIVRNGMIAGAGCMLPLSSNVNLSRDLGMRHRAGIGISENSDAVVVIVSEEIGSISVAIDGTLKRHLTPETLERVLRKELLPKETTEQKGLFDWFKRGGKADAEKDSK
jgi:TIGR00159 family protein